MKLFFAVMITLGLATQAAASKEVKAEVEASVEKEIEKMANSGQIRIDGDERLGAVIVKKMEVFIKTQGTVKTFVDGDENQELEVRCETQVVRSKNSDKWSAKTSKCKVY